MKDGERQSLWQILGPGMLYAAAAVGVSHLVQATRAGADYGFGLALFVLLACVVKYPAIRFGAHYASITGSSLITSYRSAGRIVFAVYALAQLVTMVFVIAAISLFTLGMLKAALRFEVNNIAGVATLLAIVGGLLVTGKYVLLERLTKVIVVILTLLIVLATLLVSAKIDWHTASIGMPKFDLVLLVYIVGIVGFMPTPTDGSVVQSLWIKARGESGAPQNSISQTMLDFNIGYIGSCMLAICFLVLGAGIMHTSELPIAASNGGFAAQLIQLFTAAIGSWSFGLIGTVAVLVIFSTLLTVVDAMSRIVRELIDLSRRERFSQRQNQRIYSPIVWSLCAAAVITLATAMRSFAAFIDLAGVLVFVVSPMLAYLNHRAVFGDELSIEHHPGTWLRIWSTFSVVILGLVTLLYFYARFISGN